MQYTDGVWTYVYTLEKVLTWKKSKKCLEKKQKNIINDEILLYLFL